MFGGGQAPSPAQVALAKQFARANLRSFFVAIGLLRATASLSPWTGLSSPHSLSDFEPISDSEIRNLNPALPPPPPVLSLPVGASNLARSLGRAREASQSSVASSVERFGRGEGDDSDANRGDDEDSSAFEDARDGEGEQRGRGRTRRRDPELKRSMLEDALRSSLATLLSLAPGPSGMSQTPSMSHASLTSLLSSTFQPTASSSSSRHLQPQLPQTGGKRASPFASALEDSSFDDYEGEEEDETSDVLVDRPSSSSAEDVFLSSSSSDDEDRTQLGRSSPIPMSFTAGAPHHRYRSYSDEPAPSSSSSHFPSVSDPQFSPLQPSRPLGTSGSPPIWSRRRGAAPTRGRRGGGEGGRGKGRGMSTSPGPGPASLEERRMARAKAAAAAQGAARSAGEAEGGRVGRGERREGRTATDMEDGEGRRDETFSGLLSTARFFSDLSPRASRTSSSFPSTSTSLSTSASTTIAPLSAFASASTATQPLFASVPSLWPASPSNGASSAEGDDDDPALTSESAPTLEEGLSSSGFLSTGRSRSPSQDEKSEEMAKDEQGGQPKKEKNPKRRGFLSWLRGLGSAVVELKVWHLVGICGVLIGVGLGAGHVLRTLLTSTPPFLDLLDPSVFSPSSSGQSLIRVPPRLAKFSGGAGGGGGAEGGEKMGALFL
ncbi:hypothetical protein JCM8547_002745 [Rhodosporidiobolus lusitaniae]